MLYEVITIAPLDLATFEEQAAAAGRKVAHDPVEFGLPQTHHGREGAGSPFVAPPGNAAAQHLLGLKQMHDTLVV